MINVHTTVLKIGKVNYQEISNELLILCLHFYSFKGKQFCFNFYFTKSFFFFIYLYIYVNNFSVCSLFLFLDSVYFISDETGVKCDIPLRFS